MQPVTCLLQRLSSGAYRRPSGTFIPSPFLVSSVLPVITSMGANSTGGLPFSGRLPSLNSSHGRAASPSLPSYLWQEQATAWEVGYSSSGPVTADPQKWTKRTAKSGCSHDSVGAQGPFPIIP